MNQEAAWDILNQADLILDVPQLQQVLDELAAAISTQMKDQYPLVLSVMGGAVVFTGQLLPRLRFPLDFDYIHVSRYGNKTQGGELHWHKKPHDNVEGRVVLVLDDILDEGETMAAIRDQVLAQGAKAFYSAVFTNKLIQKPKPIVPDFVGLDIPDCYVFGFGMDVQGMWRNLPALYAVKP